MLKVQNVIFADQDPFIWTLLIPRDAPLAFVLGQPATVAAQIVVEPRCIQYFFLCSHEPAFIPLRKCQISSKVENIF